MRIGLDLGGTKCLGVAIEVHPDDRVEVIAEHRAPTPQGAEAIIATMAQVVAAIAAEAAGAASVSAATEVVLGVGVPGLITRSGVMRASPNLAGMYEVNIGEDLLARLRADHPHLSVERVVVDNDANCAAIAEWTCGVGRGVRDLVLVTLGTGIGGGLVIDGRPYRGGHGFAGEFGHMVVEPMGEPCPCGQRGCWERYGSGSGLALLGARAGVEPTSGRREVRAEDVVAAARAGSQVAAAVLENFARWVAIGMVNLANIVDPEMILIAGGLAEESDLFLPSVRRWFGELLYEGSHREHPVIAVAECDHRAGAIGAALAAAL